jgi:hypothetical protein
VTLLSVGRVKIIGYRDRIFVYREKSRKSMRAAMTAPRINVSGSASVERDSPRGCPFHHTSGVV